MEKLFLDLVPNGIVMSGHASQNDKTRTIRFYLTNSGSAVTLAGTEVIVCNITKPDGSSATINVTNTSSNYVDVDFTSSELDISGSALCELSVDGIGSLNFILRIEEDAYNGANIEIRTASGEIATFDTNISDNLIACKCDINAIQSGSGTPSPSNPRAITGFTGCKINYVNFNQLFYLNTSTTANVSKTLDTNGVIHLSGLANATFNLGNLGGTTFISGHKYFLSGKTIANPNNIEFTIGVGNGQPWITDFGVVGEHNLIFTNDYASASLNGYNATGKDFAGIDLTLNIFDLTAMFGARLADYLYSLPDKGLSILKQLLYKDYYAYDNSYTSKSLASVNGDNYPNGAISWQDEAGTVYGGVLDVTNGKLTITHGIVDLGSLTWTKDTTTLSVTVFRAIIPDRKGGSVNFICSNYENTNGDRNTLITNDNAIASWNVINSTLVGIRDDNLSSGDATAFKSAMSGVMLVYELATPTEIQLTPKQIETLLGTNNIFSDTGEIEVSYLWKA